MLMSKHTVSGTFALCGILIDEISENSLPTASIVYIRTFDSPLTFEKSKSFRSIDGDGRILSGPFAE